MPAHAQEAAAGREPGDILVTAQRVEERLQDVPITISALDGEALAERGVRSMAGLRGQVPNLYIEPSLGQQTTIWSFCRAKTCSMRALTLDFFALALAVRPGMGRLRGFLR